MLTFWCPTVLILNVSPPVVSMSGVSKQRQAALQPSCPSTMGRGPETEPLPPFHLCQPLECIVEETEGKLNELGQRISAIEKAQLQSLELIQGEPLTKDKIEELKKSREEQVISPSTRWKAKTPTVGISLS